MDTHQKRHDSDVVMGSEKSFGIVFAAIFALIGLWPLWRGGDVRLWALGVAAAFLVAAFLAPKILRPLNVAWFGFGLLLSKVMTPLVMSIIYVVTVVPIGIFLRLTGKDLLRLQKNPEAKSYWIVRERPGPEKGSMKQQF